MLYKTSKINDDRISEIVEEVGYWRKANAIHAWFVKNVQDGNDDCQRYYVPKEKLQELLDTVRKVLDSVELVDKDVVNGYSYKDGVKQSIIEKGCVIKDPAIARQLLPTQEGFFFGSMDYIFCFSSVFFLSFIVLISQFNPLANFIFHLLSFLVFGACFILSVK